MIKNNMKPIKFQYSLTIFGVAALLFLFNERFLLPYLGDLGINKILLLLIMAVPHIIFFMAAIIGYKIEGNELKWTDFRARFRFNSIKGKMWLWVILIVIVDAGLYIAMFKLVPFVKFLHDTFPPPEILNEIIGDGETFAGYATKGNWLLLLPFLFY